MYMTLVGQIFGLPPLTNIQEKGRTIFIRYKMKVHTLRNDPEYFNGTCYSAVRWDLPIQNNPKNPDLSYTEEGFGIMELFWMGFLVFFF